MNLFACPMCGAQFRVKPEMVGRQAKCPKCGDRITIELPKSQAFPALEAGVESSQGDDPAAKSSGKLLLAAVAIGMLGGIVGAVPGYVFGHRSGRASMQPRISELENQGARDAELIVEKTDQLNASAELNRKNDRIIRSLGGLGKSRAEIATALQATLTDYRFDFKIKPGFEEPTVEAIIAGNVIQLHGPEENVSSITMIGAAQNKMGPAFGASFGALTSFLSPSWELETKKNWFVSAATASRERGIVAVCDADGVECRIVTVTEEGSDPVYLLKFCRSHHD